ncbi:MAG: hypothetical protein RLY61_437 [Candidatus Parcubacteria bacterium]
MGTTDPKAAAAAKKAESARRIAAIKKAEQQSAPKGSRTGTKTGGGTKTGTKVSGTLTKTTSNVKTPVKTGGGTSTGSTTKTSGKQPIATGKTPKIEYNYGNQMSTRDSALFAPKVNAYAKANPNTPKFTMTNTEGKGIQYEKQYVGKGKDGKTYKVTASNQKNAGKKYGVTKWTESTPKQITVSRKTK